MSGVNSMVSVKFQDYERYFDAINAGGNLADSTYYPTVASIMTAVL